MLSSLILPFAQEAVLLRADILKLWGSHQNAFVVILCFGVCVGIVGASLLFVVMNKVRASVWISLFTDVTVRTQFVPIPAPAPPTPRREAPTPTLATPPVSARPASVGGATGAGADKADKKTK